MKSLAILYFLIQTSVAYSADLSTNETMFSNAPSWLTAGRVDRVVGQVQRYLEWDIRKVRVNWYSDQQSFQNFHGYDSSVLAVSRKSDNSIHIGPRVNQSNFDAVFGHELVHTILFQKFKDAIPNWLDEGLANYVSKHGKIDYAWLASQPARDVRTLAHPFQKDSASTANPRYHYQASTALIELLASKCNLNDLLQLSMGQKLEGYISTFCRIPDINSEFQKWLKKKSTPLRNS
jgi:hypothetical protein